ncbi:phage tail protein [Desmospora activa]|uniref:Phage minor structural protein n=1 Tax=Desmospora activa DSM 45169 TaxID=1121389 RepID=A0A2T4Z924_9BACL|nr:phage tail protein [Desmospora activa]PTM58388.1 phage minor structural protein [Desmospora activa DSM 45169]
MMIITSLEGQAERLTDYTQLTRKRAVNGDRSLSFWVPETDRNRHAFPLVAEESTIEYDGEKYVIKSLEKRLKGRTPVKVVEALHKMIPDLVDNYIYDTESRTLQIIPALSFALHGTGYTFTVQGSFSSKEFENFGDDNSLRLLTQIMDRYGAEFDIQGTHLTIKNEIGGEPDFVFRYKHNTKALVLHSDTKDLATYIRGYGAIDEETGEYLVTAEYTSSKAYGPFGIRHAPPVRDERFYNYDALLEECKRRLKDEPEMSLQLSFVELKEQGYPDQKPGLGDRVPVIHEPLGLELTARILEITDYPESLKSPDVVLANIRPNMPTLYAGFQNATKRLAEVMDPDGNITTVTKKIYSNSHVYQDNLGYWAVNPVDPRRYVFMGSGGIDVRRGLIRVEREDGFPIIIGGELQYDLNIQGAIPMLKSTTVSIGGSQGIWWETSHADQPQNCQFFTYEHKARYLVVRALLYVEAGARAYFSIETGTYGQGNVIVLGSTTSTNTDPDDTDSRAEEIRIDLGTPTGNRRAFYLRLRSSRSDRKVYARVSRLWLEG